MKINKIDPSWYNEIKYGGNKSNRGIYLNGQTSNRWLVKTNKQKVSNNPESRVTIHRQTVLSEYVATYITGDVGLYAQEVTLLLNENDELCVACRDFTRPEESIVLMSDNSSRDTKSERFVVNDFYNYIEPVLFERLSSSIKQALKEQYFKQCVFDYLVANPDRHLGNWGYIINRETGDLRLCPCFDFGAGLGSQLGIYSDNIEEIVHSKETEEITKLYQTFNGIEVNEKNIKEGNLPKEFYDACEYFNFENAVEVTKNVIDRLKDSGFVENIRLDLMLEIIKYRASILSKFSSRDFSYSNELDKVGK